MLFLVKKVLLEQYSANHPLLQNFVLSPGSLFSNCAEISVCKECINAMRCSMNVRSDKRYPPKKAIASGNLIGDAPEVLKRLTRTELDLVAAGRIECQSYVFFGGCHQQVRGWHTIFRNRPGENVSSLELLAGSGLRGTIVVVLCGPFTTTQRALVKEKCLVRPEYVIEAFKWLKEHNYLYKDFVIPALDEIPVPIIHDENVYVLFHMNDLENRSGVFLHFFFKITVLLLQMKMLILKIK